MTLGPLGLIDLDAPPPSLAQHVIDLVETYWRVPSGLWAGEPMSLSAEQVEFLWAWYEVDAVSGMRFVRRRGHLEAPKGYAKSPIGAACAFAGLVGEVVPDGFDAYGSAVGRPHPAPRVQIMGVSIDGTDNLYLQMVDALRDSAAVSEFSLDVGLTRTQFSDGRPGIIEPVTSSGNSRTGSPVSEYYREETWLWYPSNGGHLLAAASDANALKMGGRILDLTNTPIPDRESVAEQNIAAVEAGKRPSTLMVRVSSPIKVEEEEIDNSELVREALVAGYGSHCTDLGGWIDVDALMEGRPGNLTVAEWIRLFLGDNSLADDNAVMHPAFVQQARPGATLKKGDTIALGFDGSDVRDGTALYAVRFPDWTLYELDVWEPPIDPATGTRKRRKNWKVPRREVIKRIRWYLDNFNVVRGYADPAYWQTDIDTLSEEYGESFMRFAHHSATRIGEACERWDSMVDPPKDGEAPQLGYYPTGSGDKPLVLFRHAANGKRESCGPRSANWWRPVRRVQGHPIDAFSAAVSAVHAMGDAIADGKVNEEDAEDFVEVV